MQSFGRILDPDLCQAFLHNSHQCRNSPRASNFCSQHDTSEKIRRAAKTSTRDKLEAAIETLVDAWNHPYIDERSSVRHLAPELIALGTTYRNYRAANKK